MSDNPVATFSFVIPLPEEPEIVRENFTQVLFNEFKISTYSTDSPSPTGPTGPTGATGPPEDFAPDSVSALYFFPNGDLLTGAPPFVSDNAWIGLRNSPSGFITTNRSLMSKLLVPSKLLCSNGTQGSKAHSLNKPITYVTTASGDKLFNWTLLDASYTDWSADPFKVIGRGGKVGTSYVTVKNKKDSIAENSVDIGLDNQAPWPTGDWTSGSSGELVGQGAFCIVINIVPLQPGKANPTNTEEKTWDMEFTFGEVTMTLQEGGSLNVELNNNRATVQLTEAKAKEVPPQIFQFKEGTSYVIAVYPVWNGVVVSNGIQNVQENSIIASVFVPKTREANIMSEPYFPGFDPQNPSIVQITVNGDVKVNFGNTVQTTAANCRFEIAYTPLFFVGKCQFDTYWIASKDQTDPTIDYSYSIYPIWTDNDASTNGEGNTISWPNPDLGDTQEYKRTRWEFTLVPEQPNRRGPEFFGYYLRVREIREFEVARENGIFNLGWTGGTPGDPSPSSTWWRYITNISVTIGLDGSSGSLTVDKYGLAGQDAQVTQKIGAVVIDVDGPVGTVAGRIFSGLGMGTGEAESSDGSTWTIPLVGLTKKMDDMILVNAPFFDGYYVGDAIDFLCNYSGIRNDKTNAPSSYTDDFRLTASEDLATPVLDWKAGTTIADALQQTVDDVLYWYYMDRNGYVKFYELSRDDGLPVFLGPDRSIGYSNTKIMSIDQTPDFDDLRNEIVGISMRQIEVSGNDIELPLEPLIVVSENETDPEIPWSRGLVQGVPGVISEAELNDIVEKAKAASSRYEISGSVVIPGNADIEPYDRWGDYVIISVTHNIDLQAKSWNTSLELASGRED